MRFRAASAPGVRPPAVAGMFYPDETMQLSQMVDRMLGGARKDPSPGPPAALVVPHAGYVYSGPVAASAYARLRPHARAIARVVAFGPVHRVPIAGAAVPAADVWATPLGDVRIDAELRRRAAAAGAAVDDAPHAPEHAIEVQLPFLQRALGSGFTFLPVAVSELGTARTADLVLEFLGEEGTLVLVSTDLSHYLPLDDARRRDRRTADTILQKAPEKLGADDACGFYPLRGLLEAAKRKGYAISLLDLRTSGDTAGDPGRVVGYGAFEVRKGEEKTEKDKEIS